MNKIIIGTIAIIALVSILIIPGYFSNKNNATRNIIKSDIEKIEIIHFHRTQQCYSCITVGAYTEETISTYFSDELKSGKIVFGHINVDLFENQKTTKKYGATGSSLWIGVYGSDENFSKEENTNVWYKINDKQKYMEYLKGVIEEKLRGE